MPGYRRRADANKPSRNCLRLRYLPSEPRQQITPTSWEHKYVLGRRRLVVLIILLALTLTLASASASASAKRGSDSVAEQLLGHCLQEGPLTANTNLTFLPQNHGLLQQVSTVGLLFLLLHFIVARPRPVCSCPYQLHRHTKQFRCVRSYFLGAVAAPKRPSSVRPRAPGLSGHHVTEISPVVSHVAKSIRALDEAN